MLQNWQYCKENPVSRQKLFIEKLYNTGISLNLAKKIYTSWSFFSIPIRFDKTNIKQFGVSGKKGQYNYRKTGGNVLFTTIPAFFTTSIAILSIIIFAFYTTFAIFPSKIDYFSNTPCNNQQYTNIYISVLSTLPKATSNNKILSSKADKSTFYIMLKIVFA